LGQFAFIVDLYMLKIITTKAFKNQGYLLNLSQGTFFFAFYRLFGGFSSKYLTDVLLYLKNL